MTRQKSLESRVRKSFDKGEWVSAGSTEMDRFERYGRSTRLEMSFPDWRRRLARAERELKTGKGVILAVLLRKRRATERKSSSGNIN